MYQMTSETSRSHFQEEPATITTPIPDNSIDDVVMRHHVRIFTQIELRLRAGIAEHKVWHGRSVGSTVKRNLWALDAGEVDRCARVVLLEKAGAGDLNLIAAHALYHYRFLGRLTTIDD